MPAPHVKSFTKLTSGVMAAPDAAFALGFPLTV